MYVLYHKISALYCIVVSVPFTNYNMKTTYVLLVMLDHAETTRLQI